jgi:hypothetical protein
MATPAQVVTTWRYPLVIENNVDQKGIAASLNRSGYRAAGRTRLDPGSVRQAPDEKREVAIAGSSERHVECAAAGNQGEGASDLRN